MSKEYDNYLEQHRGNVKKAYEWICKNLPVLPGLTVAGLFGVYEHDKSKDTPFEYQAYDAYFYGEKKTPEVEEAFNSAWLSRIHDNPHHWQHWVLINDDPDEGIICIEMPVFYVIEMICDWWAFSWAKGNLHEIFKWYDEYKDYIKLHDKTRSLVEDILDKIYNKLELEDEEDA